MLDQNSSNGSTRCYLRGIVSMEEKIICFKIEYVKIEV